MDNNSWDKVLFDYCEGNINSEAKVIVEEEIQKDPLARHELKRWQASYVNEPTTLIFKHKESLYQPTGLVGLYSRNKKIFWSSILVLMGALSLSLIPNETTQVANTAVDSNSKKVESIIVIDKPKDAKVHKKEAKKIPLKPVKRVEFEASIKEPIKTISTPVISQTDSNHIKTEEIELLKAITSDSSGIDSSNIVSTSLSSESRIEKSNSEEKIKKKRVRRKKQRIRWKDIKESWGKKPSVVPMD